MKDELARLVADARALLEDAAARGVVAEAEVAPPPPPEPEPPVRAPSAAVAWSALAQEDRGRPNAHAELERVRAELGVCTRCALHKGRNQIVFGVGDPDADLVVVGEAPGGEEDRRGEPFVGPAGQMLDKMLENVIGLPREAVYILNVVKCRPPRNRDPKPEEVAACRPFLNGQLQVLQPKVMLVLGAVALRTLWGISAGIRRNRGTWRVYEGTPVMPTFHPAYLLRTPGDKRLTFEDLKALRRRYDELGGRR